MNPYTPPRSRLVVTRESNVLTEAPCGKCGSTEAVWKEITWWGAMLGPKLLHHVTCAQCGHTFNARTGRSNRWRIVIFLVFAALFLGVSGMICWVFWFKEGP
jgi:predicted nucleic-acid-binding Zn-ribbon protein